MNEYLGNPLLKNEILLITLCKIFRLISFRRDFQIITSTIASSFHILIFGEISSIFLFTIKDK